MSMSKSSYTYNRKTWEDAEFPILCQTCLGNNPYMRMMKEKYGKECNICQRPMTVFRWMPGKGMRYKKTEVCQTCAKIKNVCQTCLLDLEYGLPVQVRDYALQLQDDLPKQGANRDFYIQNVERQLAQSDGTTPAGALANVPDQGPNELLKKLARNQPYYDRNRPHICSFWVKGECRRGEECPFRHEKPTDPDDPLSDQNMKDRYYGSKDPVADKLLNRAKAMPVLRPPEDKNITTLYVGALGEAGVITETDLQNYFYQFGEIRNITLLPHKGCAFVQFTTRFSAEMAAERAVNKLTIKQKKLTIRWGRPQAQHTAAPGSAEKPLDPVPGLPEALPVPDFFGLESSSSSSSSRRTAGGPGTGPEHTPITNLAPTGTIPIPPTPPEQQSGTAGGVPQLTPKMPPMPAGVRMPPLVVPPIPYSMGPPLPGPPRGPPPPLVGGPNMGMGPPPPSAPRPMPPNPFAPPESLLGKKRPLPPQQQQQGPPGGPSNFAPPPQKIYYPSQDPQRLGAKGDVIE